MRKISNRIRQIIDTDPYYKKCARLNHECSGRITMEHAFIYAGKQIDEVWAIIPLCVYHHLREGLDKELNQWISIKRATIEDLAKYPKKDWVQMVKYFMQRFHWDGKLSTVSLG